MLDDRDALEYLSGTIVHVGEPIRDGTRFWDAQEKRPVLIVPIEIRSDKDGRTYTLYAQQPPIRNQ